MRPSSTSPSGTGPRPARPPVAAEGGADAVAAERRWLAEASVDVVILPSWTAHAIVRAGSSPAAGFYRRLRSGALGFARVAELRTTFPSAALYTWADPKLDGDFEAGILGYELFARRGAPQGRTTTRRRCTCPAPRSANHPSPSAARPTSST